MTVTLILKESKQHPLWDDPVKEMLLENCSDILEVGYVEFPDGLYGDNGEE